MKVRIFIVVSLLLLAWVPGSWAQMSVLSDEELAGITANGILLSPDEITFSLPTYIGVNTYTEIDSVKMGYYDDGINGLGWDQDWTNVSFGSEDQDIAMSGFFIDAQFSGGQLSSVAIGAMQATGTLSGDFQSLSRVIGGLPDMRSSPSPASQVINLDNDPLALIFTAAGVMLDVGDATMTPQ